mgnify:CR=1 FL=1
MRGLVLLLAVRSAAACGNYCGTWYCGGDALFGGASCDYSVAPREGDCADACCAIHDQCCDAEERGACNAQMVACVDACEPYSTSCLYGVLPVTAWFIRTAFRVVEDWCCNRPC